MRIVLPRDVTESGCAERTRQGFPRADTTVASTSAPAFQRRPTSNPPRARRPLTSPSFHESGRAGRNDSSFSCDCRSISAIAAVIPNDPSTCMALEQIENRLVVV